VQVEQELAVQEEQAEADVLGRNFSPLLCANTLIFFSTSADWQAGHFTFSSELLTNSSNSLLHFLHLYSNNGILLSPL